MISSPKKFVMFLLPDFEIFLDYKVSTSYTFIRR